MPTKRDKVWLTAEQVDGMLQAAKRESMRDYCLLLLMRFGLRVGEIVGSHDVVRYKRWVDRENHALGKEEQVSVVDLPGIHRQDVRREEQGLWVRGKGGEARLVPMPGFVMDALVEYAYAAGLGAGAKMFDLAERKAEQLVHQYARIAGVPDWDRPGFGPHRLRAFYATDAKDKGLTSYQIRDLMRHSKLATTELYVGRSTGKQLRQMVDKLAETDEE